MCSHRFGKLHALSHHEAQRYHQKVTHTPAHAGACKLLKYFLQCKFSAPSSVLKRCKSFTRELAKVMNKLIVYLPAGPNVGVTAR